MKNHLDNRFYSATILSAILLCAWLLPLTVTAQEMAVTHCLGSCPQYRSTMLANNSKVVIHHLYAAGVNKYNRRADWVAYRLTDAAAGIASLLSREWHPDRLASFERFSELADMEALEPDDSLPDISNAASSYGGVPAPVADEMNRVRLVPLTSFAKSPYWSELNNITNMLPMPAPVRLGAWLRLEQALNALVARQEEVHVLAGPIYFDGQVSGSASLEPGLNLAGYFKIVATDKGTAAFVFPHDMRQQESFCAQQSSVQEIARLTNLELFPGQKPAQSRQLLLDLGCPQPVGS